MSLILFYLFQQFLIAKANGWNTAQDFQGML